MGLSKWKMGDSITHGYLSTWLGNPQKSSSTDCQAIMAFPLPPLENKAIGTLFLVFKKVFFSLNGPAFSHPVNGLAIGGDPFCCGFS